MTTRRHFLSALACALIARRRSGSSLVAPGTRPHPSSAQLEWQRDELAMFLHFGVNSFTDREWGDGREDPAIFNPRQLDARQWARVARAAGFRTLILTAKHHDGFCLWPTKTTTHSVARSPWRNGHGDVVRELVDACRAEQLKVGLYLSPWDRHEPSYGDSDRYNALYRAQLTELLTQYGVIQEVWFDGANGEGPNGRKQVYDWPRTWALVRQLQRNAVIFSDAGPDIRWIGNEHGVAGETNWSTVNPSVVPYPGATGDGVMRMLQEGDPNGTVWRPGETDVSIRPGWFYHAAEDTRVKTGDELVELYFTSVGRNSKLLLNVPPTREGKLHDRDVASLEAMRRRLTAIFGETPPGGARPNGWRVTGQRRGVLEIEYRRPVTVSLADLREDVTRGQIVSHYELAGSNGGAWTTLSRGTTIGYRKLDRFTPTRVRRVRLTIEAVNAAQPVGIALYSTLNLTDCRTLPSCTTSQRQSPDASSPRVFEL
ncbi:MAG TPA: alpha-L-fucosidase [Gemmatimonadaceae bacterium]|nr:alpha-L-fucosidase [Gemmatimonadaceae bacterium]